MNTVKRYARASEPQRLQRPAQYRPTPVDPYREHLRRRRSQEPGVGALQLFGEIQTLGYTGSLNLLYRYITQGRIEGDRPPLSPRRLARLMLTHPEHLTDTQRSLRDKLAAACPEMIDLSGLITSIAALLRPQDGHSERLDKWITTARAADLPRLHAFTRGLDLDQAAAHAAVTLPYHNSGTEGVNTKPNGSCGKCTDGPASPCPATASCSADLTHRHHRMCDRAEDRTVPVSTTAEVRIQIRFRRQRHRAAVRRRRHRWVESEWGGCQIDDA